MESKGGATYKEAMEFADIVKTLPPELKVLIAKVAALASAGSDIERIEEAATA